MVAGLGQGPRGAGLAAVEFRFPPIGKKQPLATQLATQLIKTLPRPPAVPAAPLPPPDGGVDTVRGREGCRRI